MITRIKLQEEQLLLVNAMLHGDAINLKQKNRIEIILSIKLSHVVKTILGSILHPIYIYNLNLKPLVLHK